MDDMMACLDDHFGTFGAQVEPVCRDVVPDVTSRVVARTQMARELRIISLAIVHRSCLLYVGNVVNSIPRLPIGQLGQT